MSETPKGRYLAGLSLAALGIVYGDIGTSPLYAVRESFHPTHGLAVTPANILGVLSLIFWSLVLVISVKYLGFILRADNRGEGGILALAALATPMGIKQTGGRPWLIALGLFGTALLYGDGAITPAVSVLSAVEGLEVATPFFEPYIVPITIVILVLLFMQQRRGTAGIGKVFGPVTLLWFLTLAALGVWRILQEPAVLAAAAPHHAVRFFLGNGWRAFVVLGSVFLVVTGGEALYADMGHFGRRPIRVAWFAVVLPALLLNYFGQGALLMQHPEAVENPFYRMAPAWALYPVVGIATAATVIASQALISGAYSLTMHAVQLGYLPRVRIEHTSARERGQIYIPGVNWLLMLACIGLVLGFGSSSNLAAAYGVAVTTTMVITTILFFVVARERWRWNPALVAAVSGFFLFIDLAFWGANLLKIPAGGWFPLLVGALIFGVMTTWRRGRQVLAERIGGGLLPIDLFLQEISPTDPRRVRGTAVFMYGNPDATPPALLHNLKHNQVLHERVVFLIVETAEVPQMAPEERASVEDLGRGFYRVYLRYGFMEEPNVPEGLMSLQPLGLEFKHLETTYFLGRETLIPSRKPGMSSWRGTTFAIMARNARTASSFFRLPPNRVVELGAQIEL
ncbi:MAG: potassium transporter Kup [Gemmatimonadales bacterium]|nr:potassium transporter Kup [Gemmatimonadales bacterium]MDQ3426549.1 potassium transporter Kup [Gemmatimonadota bacterium]